jgi:glutamate racemase
MPIGVFDSGLGGLTILTALRRRLPGLGFVYLGDNAHAPYGPKSPEVITALTRDGVQMLFDRGCRLVVLACNTASAVALRSLQGHFVPPDRRVLGVFVPMIEVLAGRRWGDHSPPSALPGTAVALFATRATVESGAFPRELALRATGPAVFARPCDGLVDAIEAGDRQAARALVRRHVTALLAECPAPDVAVLGCTHYPLVEAEFRAALPRATRIISQPATVAESLADYLARRPEFAAAGGVRHLTTGDPGQVGLQAARFLGHDPGFAAA